MNPIICEGCGRGLQPENVGVEFDNEDLIRICGFCGHRMICVGGVQ